MIGTLRAFSFITTRDLQGMKIASGKLSIKKQWIYMYSRFTAVHLKLTQYRQSSILQKNFLI